MQGTFSLCLINFKGQLEKKMKNTRKPKRRGGYLFRVLSSAGIELLDHVGGMSNEERVAGSTRQHTDHHQPQVHERCGGLLSVPYAQHVTHRSKQRPAVLLLPIRPLEKKKQKKIQQ